MGGPFPRGRGWRWHMRARNRWHQRWHRHHAHFKHSLGARLIAIFVVLACAGSAILWASMKVEYGWLWAVPLLLLVTGLAYGGIRRLVAPLRELAAGAEAFGRGDLTHRVPIRHRDEIGDLAHRFNQMAQDIQAMLDGKRALLLAISHELRSPLTRARLHAELVDEGASKAALLDELAQMRELISALLESERLGSGHRALQVGDCDLGALAREQDQPGVTLSIDPAANKVVAKSADNVIVQRGDAANKTDLYPAYSANPQVAAIVERYSAAAKELSERPVGKLSAPAKRDGDFMKEQVLGDIIADAQLASARTTVPGTQVAFMNPGGVRAGDRRRQVPRQQVGQRHAHQARAERPEKPSAVEDRSHRLTPGRSARSR